MRGSLAICLGIAVLGACRFDGGSSVPSGDDAGPSSDADVDGMLDVDASPMETCGTFVPPSGVVTPCDVLPDADWMITTRTTFDTDTGVFDPDPPGPEPMLRDVNGIAVFSVESFTIATTALLEVRGSKPLLILSWSTMSIAGTIDVSSVRISNAMQETGAGASNTCTAGSSTTDQDSGGGGGGAFQAKGGKGGNGAAGNTGGTAGVVIAASAALVGGCSGGNGGSDVGNGAGEGGAGGGALRLVARSQITVTSTGKLHASGAGGGGGSGDSGGGGGGSGGQLGLDAPMVVLVTDATLAANGGGGGTGCKSGDGGSGANGALDTLRALGGDPASCDTGAAGGLGGALPTPAGENGANGGDSGGGGGGSVGRILIWGTLDNAATTSPAVTPM